MTAPGPAAEGSAPRLLSPSQINTYLACERKWWYQYIEHLPTTESFAQVRGTLVHALVEDLFGFEPHRGITYPELIAQLRERLLADFERRWVDEDIVGRFGEANHEQTRQMLLRFLQHLQWEMDPLYERYLDPIKVWRFTQPSFRELDLVDAQLGLRGIIDAVVDKGDEGVVLVDYKTSKVFMHPHSDEYERQLYLYALLYERLKKVRPAVVSVHYLLTGQVANYPVREPFLQEAAQTVATVQQGTTRTDKAQFVRNTGYRFCRYCDFYDHCMGDTP